MSLGEELPKEISRVIDIIREYEKIPNGVFAATLMKIDVDKALKAIAEGDITQMVLCYTTLKEYTL